MLDLFGYIGLVITLFALTRSNIKHLRIISVLGLVFFLTQSILLDSDSLITTNLTFLALHLSMLYKENKS